MFVANQQDQHTGVGSCLRVLLRSKFKTFFNLVILLYITFRLELIEEHFSKTHSVHGLLLGLSEFWKSVPQFLAGKESATRVLPIYFFRSPVCSFFNRRSFMSCCTRSPHRFFCHPRLQASSVDLCRHHSSHAVSVFKTLKLHPPLPPPSSTQN